MYWSDGAAGVRFPAECLTYLKKEAPGLAALPEKLELPGMENVDAGVLGSWVLEQSEKAGISLADQDKQALTSGFAVEKALGRYLMDRTARVLRYADLCVAMNLEAIRGELGAFDDRLHRLGRPFPGQIDSAQNVRQLVAGTQMACDEGRFAFGYDKAPRVQDAICVRATPQTHGGVRDMFTFAKQQLERDIQDQDVELSRTVLAASGLLTALADLAHISERRTFRLNDTHLSYGLPMNLVVGDVGINHGFPVVQSTQAALVAELKLLTLPTTVIAGGEQGAAYFTLCKLLKALDLTEHVMSVEVLMAGQGMDIVARALPDRTFGAGTRAALQCLRQKVAVLEENRFMAPDMAASLELLQSGALLDAAQAAAGALL